MSKRCWKQTSSRESDSVQVQLLPADGQPYVLARSVVRARKEEAMRWTAILGLMRDLVKLRRSLRTGALVDLEKVLMRWCV